MIPLYIQKQGKKGSKQSIAIGHSELLTVSARQQFGNACRECYVQVEVSGVSYTVLILEVTQQIGNFRWIAYGDVHSQVDDGLSKTDWDIINAALFKHTSDGCRSPD